MKNLFTALAKTRDALKQMVGRVLGAQRPDAEMLEAWESALIGADIPARLVDTWMNGLRSASAAPLEDRLRVMIRQSFPPRVPLVWRPGDPSRVILITGVNGSGKTTTAAKLACYARQQGLAPLLAATDTFRAAGVEQLCIWAKRVGCEIVAGQRGADAAAVAYDAVVAARSRKCDIALIDTAGRMHTKQHLMEELQKVQRSIGKAQPGAPDETWIVVDATLGNNAINQARMFRECVGLTGAVVTKLDGSSKGGFVVAMEKELALPIRFIGVGEALEDLVPFDPDVFTEALMAKGAGP